MRKILIITTVFLFISATSAHAVIPQFMPIIQMLLSLLPLFRDNLSTTISDDISQYAWMNFGGNAARTGNVDGKQGPEYGEEIWRFRESLDRAPFISSAAVVGGCVYVGSDNNHLYCFDAKTGEVIWQKSLCRRRAALYRRCQILLR